MTSSTIFSLHGKGLKLDTRADLEPYLKDVDPTIIEEIHFGGNTIGVDASEALSEFLSKTTVLKVANFADIFTGRLISEIPQALSSICDALKDKTSLVEINLSDNAFGGRSVEPMVPFLIHNRSFQILRLNNNGLGPAGGSVIANALLESARLSKAEGKTSNLRVVICGRNRLENGSAPIWAEAFAAHGTLEEVRMVQNGIRMEGITALAKGLAQNPNIQHIDLQDNTFTVDGERTGVEAWTEALSSWPHLHTLNLSDCVLSSEGEIPALIEALAEGSNPKLHTLQLQNNNLESATFEVIANAISSGLKSLMSLELQWNDVEEDDEHLENISLSLKQRGGRLFASDEEEEDSEEEEKEEQELEKEEEIEKVAKEEEAAAVAEALPVITPVAPVKDSADDLADMLSKVEIR
ncbi:RNI-like protein [Pholiota conissans]|uniref:RNI-like protein n=1 Tax=Pholiota conissans TaxID=109636 RepID=A0A9P5ZAR9_9AGAR|nr:RNI-like protein [Pholiota conissans]